MNWWLKAPNPWTLMRGTGEEPNPQPCDDKPGYMHYLFTCRDEEAAN